MSEGVFISVIASFCAIVGGYIIAKNLDLELLSGKNERYIDPILGSCLCASLGSLLGVVLYNVPLVIFGFLVVGAGVVFAVRRGLVRPSNGVF